MKSCPICLTSIDKFGCGIVRTTTIKGTTEEWSCFNPHRNITRRKTLAQMTNEEFEEALANLIKVGVI